MGDKVVACTSCSTVPLQDVTNVYTTPQPPRCACRDAHSFNCSSTPSSPFSHPVPQLPPFASLSRHVRSTRQRLRQTNLPWITRLDTPPAATSTSDVASDSASSVCSLSDDAAQHATTDFFDLSSAERRTRSSSVTVPTSPLHEKHHNPTRLDSDEMEVDDDNDNEAENLHLEVEQDLKKEGKGEEISPSLHRKRRRLSFKSNDAQPVSEWDVTKLGMNPKQRKMDSLFLMPQTQIGNFATINRRLLGLNAPPSLVSMRPILREFVSHNENQVFRINSIRPDRHFAPPFAVAFTKAAKLGGKQTLAIADEEGSINLIDPSQDNQWEGAASRTRFQAHQNAIFDLAWSQDDQILATASGDQSVGLFDVENKVSVGNLLGHTGTIKNVSWDPNNSNLLSTASRDGSIRVWDRRVPGQHENSVATVNLIKNAHGAKNKAKLIRSVTAVTYLPHQENLLASSCANDGIIKVWDLRKSHSRRVNPTFLESNEISISSLDSLRPHGIASMTLTPNGQNLYALSKNSEIYKFDAQNLTHSQPLAKFSHPNFQAGSFYVKLVASPCSKFITAGSTGGGLFSWDVHGNGQDAVQLVGHEREVSGIDWAKDRIATCSDDLLTRVWDLNPKIARLRRTEGEVELKNRYSGELE